MTFKNNFKKRLCTLALIASFVLCIAMPAMAGEINTRVSSVTTTDVANLENADNVYKVTTTSNTDTKGGAVYNGYSTSFSILASFDTSSVTSSSTTNDVLGGAIFNDGSITGITGGSFKGNFVKTTTYGENITGGGAICNAANKTIDSISGVCFEKNYAEGSTKFVYAGAIFNKGNIKSITSSSFKGNYAVAALVYAGGGAIHNARYNTTYIGIIDSISGVTFENNYTQGNYFGQGGAIANEGSIKSITGGSFKGNYVKTSAYGSGTGLDGAYGGAIFNYDSKSTIGSISDVTFENNYAKTTAESAPALGGAIFNFTSATIGSISGVTFKNNHTEGLTMAGGGAIANYGGTFTEGITDSDFIGNFAQTINAGSVAGGGAIFTTSNLLVKADTKDVTFRDNFVSAPNGSTTAGSAIYIGNPNSPTPATLTLQANAGRKIIFEDDQTIEGDGVHSVTITGGGTVEFSQLNDHTVYSKNAGIYGGTVTVSDGATLALTGEAQIGDSTAITTLVLDNGGLDFTRDARAKEYTITKLKLDAGKVGNLKLDVDLAGQTMDTINATDYSAISSTAELHVKTLTLLTDTDQDETPIPFTSNENLKAVTQYDGKEELSTHINKYKVNYDKTTGNFIFAKSGPSETTKSIGDTASIMNFAWLESVNNLQKRLGDLRGGEQSNMAWARFQRNNDDFKTSRDFNVSGNLYQVGYDFALNNQVASRGYFGLSLEAFDGTQSYEIGGGDVKSMSLGAYYTKIYDSGHYFDFILRYGRFESDSQSYDATIDAATTLDYAMNGVTISGEYGYRANLGKSGLYLEPQAEFIYGYLSGAKTTTSTNYIADIDSTNHFVTRLGLAFGQRVKNFNYYLRGSYYHDFAGTTHVKYGGTPYTQDGAQNWWEVSLGGGWNISKLSYFYAELTKHFKDVSNSLNFNVGFRFTL